MPTSNRNPKPKTVPKSKPVSKRATKPSTKAQAAAPPKKPTPPKTQAAASSKQDKVLEMLRAPSGTTIAAIMKATGWQQHSVRGFFAGTVRKKLKLNLTSVKTDDKRVYRIAKPSVVK
jgi:outer membrane biosynthesis protein TonB